MDQLDKDLWDELQDTEDTLRRQAAQLQQTAEGMRKAAMEHDGKALGLLQAADMLRNIERPQ